MNRSEIIAAIECELHKHFQNVRAQWQSRPPLKLWPNGALLSYSELCNRANNCVSPRGIGGYLTDAAINAKLPLDALIVRKDTAKPGLRHFPGAKFKQHLWEEEIGRLFPD
jgi:hypothetical protein